MVIAIPLGCFLDLPVINTHTTRKKTLRLCYDSWRTNREQFIKPPECFSWGLCKALINLCLYSCPVGDMGLYIVCECPCFDFAHVEGRIKDWNSCHHFIFFSTANPWCVTNRAMDNAGAITLHPGGGSSEGGYRRPGESIKTFGMLH